METEKQETRGGERLRAGRKKGKWDTKYIMAMLDYFENDEDINIYTIAKKHNLHSGHLYRVIKAEKARAREEIGMDNLKEVVSETTQAMRAGLHNLEVLKNSPNPIHNTLADGILNKMQTDNLSIARNIQVIGSKLLKDLDGELNDIRAKGKMNLDNINRGLNNLEIANRIMGMPKMPSTLINIQNNQNNLIKEREAIKEISITIETPEVTDAEIIENDQSNNK